jgi:hypothetical protein
MFELANKFHVLDLTISSGTSLFLALLHSFVVGDNVNLPEVHPASKVSAILN